jgi:tetratricopeptide (TPR) repeat protein
MAEALDRKARKLVQRIRKNHGDHASVEALAEHYAQAGDHASLANLMEGFGDTLQDARAAADAYVRAADAALMVADRARAEALYERALAREPSHTEALDRALRVAESARDFEAMRRILSAVIRAAEARGSERKQLAVLYFRLGQLFETHLQDPDRAAGLYRIAIDNHPQFVNAMLAARRLYARAGNHGAVSVLYEFEIEAAKLPEDKRALLVALAEHKRENCDDLNGAIAALRHACKLVPAHLSTLHKLADALIARSERISGAEGETDLKRAAEVFFQLARAVPRAEAPPLLLRALALAPEHARAEALLHELHGHHAANGGEARRGPHAGVSQRVVDERATRQVPSLVVEATRPEPVEAASPPVDAEPLPMVLRSPPPIAADQTSALSTADLLPIRNDANRTLALSTAELIPLRVEPARSPTLPPPIPPEARQSRAPAREEQRVADAVPVQADVPVHADKPARADAPIAAPVSARDQVHADAAAHATEPARAIAPADLPPPALASMPVDAPAALPLQAPAPLHAHADVHAGSAVVGAAPRLEATTRADLPTQAAPMSAPEPRPEPEPELIFTDPIDVSSASFTPPPRVERPTRARISAEFEPDPSRPVIEVNLGATTDSNLYVDMGDRIADGGVFIATYQALPAGTAVTLRITLPGELETTAHAAVTLRRESLDAFEDPAPGICVSFEALTPDGLALLERFAAKRTPLLIDDD